jgi:hypothetical protein
MTVNEALRGINAYPVPTRTLGEICERRGLSLDEEASVALLTEASFQLAKADVLLWLSYAPNVSQGGQSYSFSDDQREQMRGQASGLFNEFGEDGKTDKVYTRYGYKGNRL